MARRKIKVNIAVCIGRTSVNIVSITWGVQPMMRLREMAQLFSACHQNLIITCLQEVEGDTDTVNLDARLGQKVGILVLVPHKVGRLAALFRAVEDRVPDCNRL